MGTSFLLQSLSRILHWLAKLFEIGNTTPSPVFVLLLLQKMVLSKNPVFLLSVFFKEEQRIFCWDKILLSGRSVHQNVLDPMSLLFGAFSPQVRWTYLRSFFEAQKLPFHERLNWFVCALL